MSSLRRKITQLNRNRIIKATVLYVGTDVVSVRLSSGHILRGLPYVGKPKVNESVNVSYATGDPIVYARFSPDETTEQNYLYYMECEPGYDYEFVMPPFNFDFPVPGIPIFNPPPFVPPIVDPPIVPTVGFGLRMIYVLTTYNRVLACANLFDGEEQVWVDITPEGGITFQATQGQVDWITGSLFLGTVDQKAYYRSWPVDAGAGSPLIPAPMYKAFDAATFGVGGLSEDNIMSGLGVNQITGEAAALVYNPVQSGYESYFGMLVGTIDGLLHVSEPKFFGNAVALSSDPRTTIGNGKIAITYLVGSYAGGRLRISEDNGSTFLEHNGSLPYTDWMDQTWHVRPDPIGNLLYYGDRGSQTAITKTESYGSSNTILYGINGTASALAVNLDGQKIMSVFNGKRVVSIDGSSTWDEEAAQDLAKGAKLCYRWSGYDDAENDLWLVLTKQENGVGGKESIYFSVDDGQTHTEIGQNLKQAIINGGYGIDGLGNPIEEPVTMWTVLGGLL